MIPLDIGDILKAEQLRAPQWRAKQLQRCFQRNAEQASRMEVSTVAAGLWANNIADPRATARLSRRGTGVLTVRRRSYPMWFFCSWMICTGMRQVRDYTKRENTRCQKASCRNSSLYTRVTRQGRGRSVVCARNRIRRSGALLLLY